MRTILAVSGVVLVILTALTAGAVLAQPRSGGGGQPLVTGTGQPTTAAVVTHFSRDMGTVAQATAAKQVQAAVAAAAVNSGERARLGRKGPLGKVQAGQAAQARQSAPRVDVASAPLDIGAGASFPGIQASNAICPPIGCNPPDMALAVSSRWAFEGDNTAFAVYDRHGAIQTGWPKTFFDFFGVPDPGACAGGVPFTSDPRAFYDTQDGRFIAAALELEGSIANSCPLVTRYWIAVSQTSNPNGVWNVYAFDMSLGTTNIADFTQIGLDSQRLTFSANMFSSDTLLDQYAEIFSVSKRDMEAGRDVTAPGFFNLTITGPAGAFVADIVQPTLVVGEDDSLGAELFANTFNGFDPVSGHFCSSDADACRGLGIWAMHSADGHAPTLSFAYVSNTGAYSFPPAADQPSCAQCLDPSDLRISATPVVHDGFLYAAWETGVNNGTQVVPGILWSKVAPRLGDGRLRSATQALGSYFAFSGDDAVVYPALMPDDQGNLFMVFDHMGATTNPEVRLTALHAGNFAAPGVLLKAGEASYRAGVCGGRIPVCRWGDYSAASLDSLDGGHVWVAGEYANASGFRLNWGTFIAEAEASH
jgi:hypothetical protein